ncbi:protein kinase domain-containing protein [Caulobacter mirabilis]|uniref:Uncharacterized protein n=1 Tax=Caulobacter mirabilis TaxID=69666 RepID=A0A2D2AYE0_9CAUL|nr:winged helix-turn-helix domain-containing protein [Caulobacter mirabilis]ATQ43024.1 hypothetical protein CSW64_11695 [Caulobacter mirabilis]
MGVFVVVGSSGSRRRRRLWRFAGAEFDEASWTLRVDGQAVALEGKPLEVLHELLLRAGEVVAKEEILDSVWAGVTVVEGSLPTAVSKLRKALGAGQDDVIETVPRIGYRLTSPVKVESIVSPLTPRFSFAPGDTVPGRGQWRLDRPLGDTGAEDVWLARHIKTGDQRVFKFADAPDRLRDLKREAALSRLLFAGLGQAAPLPALLEWNFDASPYFVEYAHGGRDLLSWAAEAGGLAAIPLPQRLAVAARIARAVEAVHGMGVLHKDLKPANILVLGDGDEAAVRLVDFGSGRLLDDTVLDSFAITHPGALEVEPGQADGRSGTAAYRAPELVGDALPTLRSDVYAVGLILYQLVVGDFAASLAPGWEAGVADPLLREDVAAACAGAPEKRLGGAGELAQRLETLDERRRRAAEDDEQKRFLETQRALEDRRRARRPWVRAAAASLVAGVLAASGFAAYAVHQRDQARSAQALSEASYRFLAEDVLASVDPARASSAEETLVQAISRTGGAIEQRFRDRPEVAAYLYGSLARAFDLRSDYANATRYYEAADRAYARAGAADSAEALTVRLQHAAALALSTRPGTLNQARAAIASAEKTLQARRIDEPETTVWLESAKGAAALASDDVPGSRAHFERAYRLVETLPQTFTERQRINFGQRYAFALIRLGEGKAAEETFGALSERMAKLMGPDHADTLLLRLNLAQAYMLQQRSAEAVALTSELLPKMETRLGRDHRHTLLLLAVRQQSLGVLGRYAEAAADGERLWRAAATKDGASSFTAVAGRADVGISQCRAGQLDDGMANLRASLTALRSDLAGRMALDDGIEAAIADCLIQARRWDEAAALLKDIDRTKVAQLVGDPNWGAQVDLALAEIALGRADRARAKALLETARPALSQNKDPFVRQRVAALSQALAAA